MVRYGVFLTSFYNPHSPHYCRKNKLILTEMGARSWFRAPRSWHVRNAGTQILYRNAERERIETIISRFCEEIKNILTPPPYTNTQQHFLFFCPFYTASINSNQCCGAGPFLTGSGSKYFFHRLRLQLLKKRRLSTIIFFFIHSFLLPRKI